MKGLCICCRNWADLLMPGIVRLASTPACYWRCLGSNIYAVLSCPLCRAVISGTERVSGPQLAVSLSPAAGVARATVKVWRGFQTEFKWISKGDMRMWANTLPVWSLLCSSLGGSRKKEFVHSLQGMEGTPHSATKSACNGSLPLPTFLAGCRGQKG